MRSIATVLALAAVAGVALAAGTTVTGVVKDSNGKPLAEVTVRLAPTDRSRGYRPVKATKRRNTMMATPTMESRLWRKRYRPRLHSSMRPWFSVRHWPHQPRASANTLMAYTHSPRRVPIRSGFEDR